MEKGEIGLFDNAGRAIIKLPISYWDARNDEEPCVCITLEGEELVKLFKNQVVPSTVLQITLPFKKVREIVK